MCVDTIFLSFFNSFSLSATKISLHDTLSPPCSNSEWRRLSVDTLHLIVPPCLRKKQADFGDLSRNMPYCQCTLPYGDCKAIMHVGSLPNCGELFTDFWHPQRLVDMKSMKVGSGRLPGGNLNIRAGSPCKGPPPIFWGLSCERPWALARDFTVLLR